MKMVEQAYEMYEQSGMDAEEFCSQCPFRQQCQAQQAQYGCGVWEEMMGEDL